MKRNRQYLLIILLFVAANTLYFFAQRDTTRLSTPSHTPADITFSNDTLKHLPAGNH